MTDSHRLGTSNDVTTSAEEEKVLSWACYLLFDLKSNQTYVGSSNNPSRRLSQHNEDDPNKKTHKGARRTRGRTSVPVLVVHGFCKHAALSFESNWKRLCFKRSNKRLSTLNAMLGTDSIKYGPDQKWNRVLDLCWFLNNLSVLGTKCKNNYKSEHIFVEPPQNLIIELFLDSNIETALPWPHFVKFILNEN
jgi:predicted GIY-YIG superfamily endonuclease